MSETATPLVLAADMPLRDLFAWKAYALIVTTRDLQIGLAGEGTNWFTAAYEMADAMLAASGRGNTLPAGWVLVPIDHNGAASRAMFDAWALKNWPNSHPPDAAWKGWQMAMEAILDAARPVPSAEEPAP